MLMTTLITGGTGNLGSELVKLYPDSVHPSHIELDITNETAVMQLLTEAKMDKVIHCAALTSIRRCEEDRDSAFLTNVEGTRNLVNALASSDSLFVYVSTASVFYGDKGQYTELDTPYPKNFYSLTKLLGEFVVTESHLANYLIVRVNFASRKKWAYSRAFTDRFGSYLFSDDAALAMKRLIDQGQRGLVHVCGERMSMFELAKITTPDILPMTIRDYAGPPLPVDMSLKSVRIADFPLTRKT